MKLAHLAWKKIAARTLLAIAAVAALYLGIANLALSTRLIAKLVSAQPDALRLNYAGARSFWPGRAHVEALELRGRSSKLEWQLHVDTADADISLLALLRHRLHVAKVTATGVSFRLRFRLEPDAINPDRVARLAPIDGFDPTPIMGVPPDPESNGTGWTIDLQKVDAVAVREVWIDAFRVAGLLRAQGGFTVGAGRLTLAPSTAEIQGVSVATGEDTMASDVTGALSAQFETADLGAVQGLAVLRYLTMHSSLQGEAGDIRFIRHFIGDAPVAPSGGTGRFEGETNVVRGRVTQGTRGHLALKPATIVIADHTVAGRVDMDLTTGDPDEEHDKPWVKLAVGVADLSLTQPNAGGPSATCKTLATTAHADLIDLADPESAEAGFAYTWTAPRIDVLDLHAVDETIPKDSPVHIAEGTASLSVEGRGTVDGASAKVVIDSRVAVRVRDVERTFGIKGVVPLEAAFVARTLDLANTDLTLSDPRSSGWWGRGKLGVAMIHFAPPSFSLAASTTARDGGPLLPLCATSKDGSPVTAAIDVVIDNPLTEALTANLHGEIRLGVSAGAVDLKELDVRGAASRLRGVLKKRGGALNGGLLVEAGALSLGIGFANGKSSLVTIEPTRWFETSVARVEARPLTPSLASKAGAIAGEMR